MFNFRNIRPIWFVLTALLIFIVASCLVLLILWNRASQFRTALGTGMPSLSEIYNRDRTLLQEIFGKIDLPEVIDKNAVCGSEPEILMLAIGIDQRSHDYLYGLADVIRIVRVDFTAPHINVVALPRAMLVTMPPDRLNIQGPILLNQAYFFGAPGMGHYRGENFGAGSLDEALQLNFGVDTDQYMVVDFQAFRMFIDAIGGIDIDLPNPVDDLPSSFFPAGPQHLDGAQALTLARVRSKYSDLIRMDNQTLIMKAIFNKLKEPATLVLFPQIYETLSESYVTDLSADQFANLACLLPKLESSDIQFFSPPEELITSGFEYIPNMRQEMEIFRWDERIKDWLTESIYAEKAGSE